MDGPRCTSFLAVDRCFRETFDLQDNVLMSVINPSGKYIGLRYDWIDAVVRARLSAAGAIFTLMSQKSFCWFSVMRSAIVHSRISSETLCLVFTVLNCDLFLC